MSVHDPQTDQWHVDRRVPLALIWTIAAQTAALIIAGTILWAEVQTQGRDLARLDAQAQREVSRIDAQLQREVTRIDGKLTEALTASQVQAVQLGRIEENLAAMRSDIRRLVAIWEGAP